MDKPTSYLKIHSLNEVEKQNAANRRVRAIGNALIGLGIVCFLFGIQLLGQALIG